MKKLLLLTFLFLPILSFSQDITSGLVGYWPFNGNANDESGNNNHGTLYGPTLTSDRFGNPNSAYYFDGNNQYIEIQNQNLSFEGSGQEFTICLWFKNENDFGGGLTTSYLISKGPSSVAPWADYSIRLQNDFDFDWLITPNYGRTTIYPTDDEYHFIVVVKDIQNGLSIYIDGELQVTGSTGSQPLYNRNSLIYFGTLLPGTTDRPVEGIMDDIRFYDRVLSQEEIDLLYGEVTNNTPSPVLCEAIFCDDSNIGIGTPNTHGYKLAVAGDIITEEIKVATQTNWPDYVFHPEYQILSLEELEQYIQQNQKLPGIPSASEAESNGIELGEMNRLLLEKIEELTLYLIEQEKRIKKLEEENKQLKTTNKKKLKLINQ